MDAAPILYQGLLRSPASWARVGRGATGALASLGHEVLALAPRGFLFDRGIAIPDGVREVSLEEARRVAGRAVGIGFLHPPLLDRLLGAPRANLFVWESDVVPAAWVTALRDGADVVVVPSDFTREALTRSGLEAGRVVVSPYGHDGCVPDPEADRERPGRPFTFLSVIAPHRRKGVPELLAAYAAAFGASDDVVLRIKTTYDPARRRRRASFEIDGWEAALSRAGLTREGAPPVALEVGVVPDDAIGRLIDEADVCVQPSWGESFGLVPLEAMARGRPCIATGWGGHVEYFPYGDDLLPFDLIDDDVEKSALYEPAPGARLAVPRIEALVERLRWHHEHPDASRRLGRMARKGVREMTWRRAAEGLVDVLSQ